MDEDAAIYVIFFLLGVALIVGAIAWSLAI